MKHARRQENRRLRLGGFDILPRVLDKGRAHLAGTAGAYVYGNPLDKRLFDFLKIDADALLSKLAEGLGDGAVLAWILENAGHRPTEWEIAAWSETQERRAHATIKAREYALKQLSTLAPERTDIVTGFDLLDLDDHVSFGGKA